MEFLWPPVLWLLIIVPALVAVYVWMQRRRRRYALRYSSLLFVKEAQGKVSRWRRHIPPALFLLGLAVMLVAFARPVSVVTLPKQEGTVILAIDVSGSMRADDLKPNRIEAAKAAARAFIEKQEASTRIGIVAFSGTAALVQAPTTDHAAALAAIDRLYTQRSTAIGSGILTALEAIFEKAEAELARADVKPTLKEPGATPTPVPPGVHIPAIIVLLTDGQNVQGPSPIVAAQVAAERGVRVYTIGVGTTQGTSLQTQFGGSFRTFLDEKTLKQVAAMTDALYFHATNEQALTAIYQNLDTQLILKTQRTEITAVFTALAAGFSLVAGVLSLLWFNRLP